MSPRAPMFAVIVLLALPAVATAGKGAGASLPALPDAYEGATTQGPRDARPWWSRFESPGLDAVVRTGLSDNLDLAGAVARVEQAKALQQTALAALLPQVTFDSSINAQPANLRLRGFGIEGDEPEGLLFFSGSSTFRVGVELDVFGRNVLGAQAGTNDTRAAEAEADRTRVTLASTIAGSWFDVALQRARIDRLEAQVKANEDILEIAQLRVDRGEASAVEVLQQQQNLAATRAQLPVARAGETLARQQLAVLLGLPPAQPIADLPSDLPDLPPTPTVGRPAELLEARPDLDAAAHRLDAAWRRRMQAERRFLPTIQFSTNAGWNYQNNAGNLSFGMGEQPDPKEVTTWFNWGFGGSVTVPIFDGGRTIAGLRNARATERAAAHTYGSARLSAVRQVEAALAQDTAQGERLVAARDQARAASEAYAAARDRYAAGIGDYLSVLTALVSRQNAELQALQAHRDALSSRIQLHESLGGAWLDTLSTEVP